MGKPISQLARMRLTNRLSQMSGGGVVNMKKLTEDIFRILPCDLADPNRDNVEIGERCVQIWSNSLHLGTTSPLTYGKPCPINDKLKELKADMTADEKKVLQDSARISSDNWLPVIQRSDPGTASSPKILALPCKSDPYVQVINFILADQGDDITGKDDGRDFKYGKTGSGFDTKHAIVKFYDPSPVEQPRGKDGAAGKSDPAYRKALLKVYSTYDIRAHFWPMDWAKLEQIYLLLTDGEPIPQTYKDAFKDVSLPTSAPAGDEDDLDAVVDVSAATEAAEAPEEVPATTEVPDADVVNDGTDQFVVGAHVSYSDEGVDYAAVIKIIGNAGADGDKPVDLTLDSDGSEVSYWLSGITFVAPPDPVVPKPVLKKPGPVVKKPVLSTGKPAAPVVNKPNPAAAAKTATASSKLASKLKTMKGK